MTFANPDLIMATVSRSLLLTHLWLNLRIGLIKAELDTFIIQQFELHVKFTYFSLCTKPYLT